MEKLSIIIPSFNQGMYLEETILSIINQQFKKYEIIIIDGGSTDNSIEIIKKYEKFIAYWHSKRDKGQSNAINQGILKSTGDYVTWLNSDDVLLPNALNYIAHVIEKNPNISWFLGNEVWMNKYGQIVRIGKVEKESKFWNKRFLFSNGGPTAIMKKDRLIEIGLLREDFHYKMDTELWCRFLSKGDYFIRIEEYCWALRLHELAKMSGHNFKDSAMYKKNHPSWIQKDKEDLLIKKLYSKPNKLIIYLWRLKKIFSYNFYTKYIYRNFLKLNYKEIIQK